MLFTSFDCFQIYECVTDCFTTFPRNCILEYIYNIAIAPFLPYMHARVAPQEVIHTICMPWNSTPFDVLIGST